MLRSLLVLDLSHTNVKGFTDWNREGLDKTLSLSLLQNLIHLESLNLEDTLLRDEAIQPLSLLQELKYLYPKSDYLSDISLHAVSSLPKLEVRHEQIQMLNAYQSHSHRATTASDSPLKFRPKGEKMLRSPSRYPSVIYADERIKYSREELFESQLSPLVDPFLCHPDKLPQVLRRD